MKSKKGRWDTVEDAILTEIVSEFGIDDWTKITKVFLKRSSQKRSLKQIRQRWISYLNEDVDKSPWTTTEELKLFEEYKEVGKKWALIATKIPGRVENDVKNRFNTIVDRTVRRFRRRQRGFDSEIVLTPSNAPSHILRVLKAKFIREQAKNRLVRPQALNNFLGNESNSTNGVNLDAMVQAAISTFDRWGEGVDWTECGPPEETEVLY